MFSIYFPVLATPLDHSVPYVGDPPNGFIIQPENLAYLMSVSSFTSGVTRVFELNIFAPAANCPVFEKSRLVYLYGVPTLTYTFPQMYARNHTGVFFNF